GVWNASVKLPEFALDFLRNPADFRISSSLLYHHLSENARWFVFFLPVTVRTSRFFMRGTVVFFFFRKKNSASAKNVTVGAL
ncbi:MAG: hypothetical protein J6I42_14210, partial [Clostridia bacterium]|nr:hypothetical protein [Clostridia bacterium]